MLVYIREDFLGLIREKARIPAKKKGKQNFFSENLALIN